MDQLRLRARVLRNHSTDAERHLWQRLRLAQIGGFKFRRQVPIAGYVADFVCAKVKLIVELDGGQHVEQSDYDGLRTRTLEAMGYRVVRYWNDDVLLQTQDVLDDLLRVLQRCVENKAKAKSTPPQPSPSLREREGANSHVNSSHVNSSHSNSSHSNSSHSNHNNSNHNNSNSNSNSDSDSDSGANHGSEGNQIRNTQVSDQ